MIIEYADNFLKEAKQLSKKFKLLKSDLKQAVDEIETKNDLGVYLGFNLFKKRVKNSSIPTGKSGGFRVIIYQQIENKIVLIVGTQRIWPARAFTLGHLTHNDLAS